MSLIKVNCPELLYFGYVLNIELTLLELINACHKQET